MKWTLLMASMTLVAGLSAASAQSDLDALRWKNRILVLFAPSADDPAFVRQSRTLLADRKALAERELVVLGVAGDRVETLYGDPKVRHEAGALRRHFGRAATSPFEAILIGKDGGVKWRRDALFDIGDLNAVIDAMPMRRALR
ncbi:DUF4174 domain-containing protein [Aureimonas sp. AU40]|uniref:DUF4174 domain-containing protein n=1 Tax=Aureimonas sp. AU40 TaxID=1637747 RepID=UPI000783EB1F|nr:DUF4174 domain-containing protein [Aureimonas sp. AU40]